MLILPIVYWGRIEKIWGEKNIYYTLNDNFVKTCFVISPVYVNEILPLMGKTCMISYCFDWGDGMVLGFYSTLEYSWS